MPTESERIWLSKGCEVCRARWSGPLSLNLLGEPRELGESPTLMGQLGKCAHCSTYWTWGFHYPAVITAEEAAHIFADLADRERAAGL